MDIEEEGKDLKANEIGNVVEGHDGASEDNLSALSRQGQTRQTQKRRKRRVSFPDDECIVSKTVEPVNPWANGEWSVEIIQISVSCFSHGNYH